MSHTTFPLSAASEPAAASAFTPQALPATQLHAKPSATFDAKLAEIVAVKNGVGVAG